MVSSFRFCRTDRQRLLRTFLPSLVLLVLWFCAERVASEENYTEIDGCITDDFEFDQDIDTDLDSEIGDINNATEIIPIGDGAIVNIENNAYSAAADSVLFPWFVQLFGCVAIFVLKRFNLPVPFAALMFVFGALMGYWATREKSLEGAGDDDSRRYLQDSIIAWTNIDPATLLLVFLPGLIFKDAVDIPINLFQVAGVQIWILAFPMVLVGTVLTAVVSKYLLPYDSEDPSSFGWFAWILLGAILASTDPIAVASVLKTAGASPRLVMHISGESLMNDGSSYVFFQIASQLWYLAVGLPVQIDITTWGKGIGYFFRMSFGGTLMGTLFGFGLLGILWELDRKMEKDFDIIQVVLGLSAAYLCYFVCDQVIQMSGVIATVACGIVVNRFGRGLIHDKELMSSYLALADFLLNTLLFVLGGVIWAAISFSSQQSEAVNLMDWGYLIFFYILCMIVRFIQVGLFYPILSRIGLKSNWKEGVFLAYGGLHGTVGVALGLSLVQYVFQHTEDPQIRNAATKLQFLGGGATFLTLTINGTSAGAILKMLGLVKPPVSAEYVKQVFEGAAKDFVNNEMAKLFQEKRFQTVSFLVLKDHVPFVGKEPPKLSISAEEGGGNQETTIQKFHQRVVAEGEQYINLLNATTRASIQFRAPAQRDQYKTELLVEMREIFLELLREAYKVEEEMGELDQTQHNGYLFDVLMQSVDLAINEVRYDQKPIEDWQHTEIFFRWDRMKAKRLSSRRRMYTHHSVGSNSNIEPASVGSNSNIEPASKRRSSNASFAESLKSMVSFESSDEHDITELTHITMKRIRLDVLRAFAFSHGHKMAEAKLQLYVNRFENDEDEEMRARHSVTAETLQTVLSESRDQVALVEEMLEEEVSDKDLEIILSHYCAKILVRRLRNFTEEKSKVGMIGKQEARTYLQKMREIVFEVDSNTVDRLAESRISIAKIKEHRRTQSDALQSIPENWNEIFDDDKDRGDSSSSIPRTLSTPHFEFLDADIQNANTSSIGHRIFQGEELSATSSFIGLFSPASALTENTVPVIEKKSESVRSGIKIKEKKKNDGYASA